MSEYIHAEKNESGTFEAEKLCANLEEISNNYEYGDVKEGNYQVWEYPSGKIFEVKPDREVAEKDFYATTHGGGGVIWLPKFEEVGKNKDQVEKAYLLLTSPQDHPGLLTKLIYRLKKK